VEAAISAREKEGWRPSVVKTIAADGSGIDDLMKELLRHEAYCATVVNAPAAKVRATSNEIREAIKNRLLKEYLDEEGSRGKSIETHAGAACRRQIDPYLVADIMLAERDSDGSD
jgi:LAO/AO transport system kinase